MPNGILDQEAIEGMRSRSKYIAIVIRNAMEDFHQEHLTDEQMKELNPIIRNAVFTAIYALETKGISKVSRDFVERQRRLIPRDWEEPEFLPGFEAEEETAD